MANTSGTLNDPQPGEVWVTRDGYEAVVKEISGEDPAYALKALVAGKRLTEYYASGRYLSCQEHGLDLVWRKSSAPQSGEIWETRDGDRMEILGIDLGKRPDSVLLARDATIGGNVWYCLSGRFYANERESGYDLVRLLSVSPEKEDEAEQAASRNDHEVCGDPVRAMSAGRQLGKSGMGLQPLPEEEEGGMDSPSMVAPPPCPPGVPLECRLRQFMAELNDLELVARNAAVVANRKHSRLEHLARAVAEMLEHSDDE